MDLHSSKQLPQPAIRLGVFFPVLTAIFACLFVHGLRLQQYRAESLCRCATATMFWLFSRRGHYRVCMLHYRLRPRDACILSPIFFPLASA